MSTARSATRWARRWAWAACRPTEPPRPLRETSRHFGSFVPTSISWRVTAPSSFPGATSPLPDEGKSTVAAWLAYANAVAGRQTILVECDFRRPVLSERFDLDPSPGLADYLAGNAQLDEVLRTVAVNVPWRSRCL